MSTSGLERRRFQRLLAGTFALPVIAFGLVGTALVRQIGHLVSVTDQVDRSNQVLTRATTVYRLILDQETGLRGYALALDAAFLERSRRAQLLVGPALEGLERSVSQNPAQARRVAALRLAQGEWLSLAEADGRIPPAARRAASAGVESLMRRRQVLQRMREHLTSFILEEERLRQQGVLAAQESVRVTFLAGGGLTAGGGILLGVIVTMQLLRLTRSYEQVLQGRAESSERLERSLGVARAVTSVAGCLLWYADVEDRGGPSPYWDTRMLDEEAARRALPVDVPPGQSFVAAAYQARIYDDPEAYEAMVLERLQRNEGFRAEFRCRVRDGSIRWFVEEVQLRAVAPGKWWAVGVAMDITDRKMAEAALRRSEERFRALVQNSADIISIVEADGTLVYTSPSVTRALGYRPEDLVGRNVYERLHPDERARLREVFLATDGPVRQEFRSLAADGTWRHFESVASNLLDDPHVGGVVFNCRDVTDRKRLEEQLRQAQRLEAVGLLAGGVAHDFNNMLAVIGGYTELALLRLGPEDPLRGPLQEVAKAADRAGGLTRQLLAFSRQQVLQPRLLDLRQVVGGVEKMLRRLIGEDIQLAAVLCAEPAPVLADAGQIEQVLLNLAVNSRDAMPAGGELTIEVRNVEIERDYVEEHLNVEPGPYVLLAVSDTGCGMDAETQARVFEPFFTTKGPGKGTGLGLATVHGIVTQSGGHIWVYSEPGHGTTFKVYLPRAAGAEAGLEAGDAPAEAPRGCESVLLAEDDATLRELVRVALEEKGYRVLEATSPEDALRLCAQQDVSIDLLLTDVVMPGMGGRELAERVRFLRPETRVLFMSGYTDDAVVRHGVLHAEVAFIQKPFTPSTLVRKVQEVLRGA